MNAKFLESCRTDLNIDESILEAALQEAEQDGTSLIQVLLRQNWWDPKDLMNNWSRFHETRFISLDQVDIDREILDRVPYEVVRDFRVIPLDLVGGSIILACAYPENKELHRQLERALESKVHLVLADATVIEKYFRKNYKLTLRLIKNPSLRTA